MKRQTAKRIAAKEEKRRKHRLAVLVVKEATKKALQHLGRDMNDRKKE